MPDRASKKILNILGNIAVESIRTNARMKVMEAAITVYIYETGRRTCESLAVSQNGVKEADELS